MSCHCRKKGHSHNVKIYFTNYYRQAKLLTPKTKTIECLFHANQIVHNQNSSSKWATIGSASLPSTFALWFHVAHDDGWSSADLNGFLTLLKRPEEFAGECVIQAHVWHTFSLFHSYVKNLEENFFLFTNVWHTFPLSQSRLFDSRNFMQTESLKMDVFAIFSIWLADSWHSFLSKKLESTI